MTLCQFTDGTCSVCGAPQINERQACGTWKPSPLGVGAELKRLLAGWPLYIASSPSCPCNAMAAQMDAWGPDGCEQRLDEIVAHLRDQAAARGLPFLDAAGRMLVRRAIRNARKAAEKDAP